MHLDSIYIIAHERTIQGYFPQKIIKTHSTHSGDFMRLIYKNDLFLGKKLENWGKTMKQCQLCHKKLNLKRFIFLEFGSPPSS